ncbi:MAG: hypothetical protein KatS3mg057_0033 [Herpetosiphonaceae bacterium]|nr:MAG: hypothetical protein KatS3mg057_0033 [Herpetosiphonaceae bacterium]
MGRRYPVGGTRGLDCLLNEHTVLEPHLPVEPVFDDQAWYASKFLSVINNEGQTETHGVGRNQQIEWFERHSSLFQGGTNLTIHRHSAIIKVNNRQRDQKLFQCLSVFLWLRALLHAVRELGNSDCRECNVTDGIAIELSQEVSRLFAHQVKPGSTSGGPGGT